MSGKSIEFISPNWPAPAAVRALTTVRHGGASVGNYRSLNLGDHVNDDPIAVDDNRAHLRTSLSLPAEPIWLKQVHGSRVVDAAAAPTDTVADGSYTFRKGVICAILTADCLPVFVCNREGTEVGLLHAGWRGLAGGVIEAGLSLFRSSREELLIWLGPAIGPAAYEVGDEVRQAFLTHSATAASAFRPSATGKWYMDIYLLARQRLEQQGVSFIYGAEYCTATQSELFFSHRRDGTTGRMASLIWLV